MRKRLENVRRALRGNSGSGIVLVLVCMLCVSILGVMPIDFGASDISDTLKKLASGSGTAIYTPVYKTDANGTSTTEIDHYVYAGTLGTGFMIAAYRSAAVDPSFDFKSAEDTSVSTQFVPMEYENSIATSAAGTAVENAKIYFKISDANLSANKTVGVQFYYQLGNRAMTDAEKAALINGEDPTSKEYGEKYSKESVYTAISSGLEIHRADTGAPVVAANVYSDTLYYFMPPKSRICRSAMSWPGCVGRPG